MPHLAVNGGSPAVTISQPHFYWPPDAKLKELRELGKQRNTDISIKGNTGPIGQLEGAFLNFLDDSAEYAVAFNAGTTALLAAYVGVGIHPGDEVIVPAITYHAAVSPLFILQARPVLVDVDENSWCLDPELIEAAITDKTKAITVVHQWGYPAEMDAIMSIANKYDLRVIEDCSHAHGSTYKDQQVGTIGDVGVFSLQANKLIFAGEGGMLVTSDPEIHDRAILLGHYRDRARDAIIDPFYQQFWQTGYGLKLRMSPFNAIVALHALRAAHSRIKSRHKALLYLRKQLEQLSELLFSTHADHIFRGAWYGCKPRYLSEKLKGISREMYIKALQAEGVNVSAPSSPPFSLLPLFQIKDDKLYARNFKYTYKEGDFPIAEMLAETSLSLPTFTDWPHSKKIIDQYVAAFQKVHTYADELL